MGENGNYYMEQTSTNGEFQPQRWATQNGGNAFPAQGLRGRALDISASPFRGSRADNTTTNAFGRIVDWTRYDEEGYTSEEALGENQKGIEKFGNALLNNLVIAGTTVVENTIGLGWGLLKGFAGESVWDNEVNRAMNSIQENTQENNPIYHSKEYNEKSAPGRVFTTEFWADNLQSLGFVEGMLISSLVPGALLKNAGTAANIIVKSLYSSFGEAATEALNAKNDKQRLEETQALQSFREKTADLTLVPQSQRDAYQQELYEDFKRDVANIRQDANTVGNAVLYQNLAILTLTGAGEFGPLFKRGANSAAAPFRQKLAKKGLRTFEDTKGALTSVEMALSKPQAVALASAKTLGRASLEGLEEFSQNVATKVGDLYAGYNSFNNSRFNPEARELATDLVHAGTMAIAEAVQDKDVWTEFLSGMVTGFTGGPMIRSPKNAQGKWQSPITLEGATAEGIREVKEYNRKAQIVKAINERLQDPKFQEYYEHLTRDIYLTDKINTAIDKVDDFNLKNYELAKVISDASLFESLGLLDNYKSTVASFSDLDEDSVNSLIAETTSSDGKNGPFVVNGNSMSPIEVKEKLTSNSKFIIDKIDRFTELKQLVTVLHPELNKDAIENYLYGSIQVEDWMSREASILSELYDIYRTYNAENPSDNKVLTQAEFNKLPSKDLNSALAAPFNSLNPTEREEFNKKVQDLNKIDTSIKLFQKKLEGVIKDPIKANKEAEKQQVNRVKETQAVKTKNLAQSLDNAATFSDIRAILADDSIDSAMKDSALRSSANPVAKNYLSLLQKVRTVRGKLEGIDPQVKEDITKILNNIVDRAEEIGDFDITSVLMSDPNILRNPEIAQDEAELQARSEKALNIINRIVSSADVENGKSTISTHEDDFDTRGAVYSPEDDLGDEGEDETPAVGTPAMQPEDTTDTHLSATQDENGNIEYFVKDEECSTPSVTASEATKDIKDIAGEATSKEGVIRPSTSQYDLTAMNPKGQDGKSKDIVFSPVAEAGQAARQYLATYGPASQGSTDAFVWINTGGLATYNENGGKLYFGIDPRLDTETPVVFIKEADNTFKPIAILYKSAKKIDSFRGLRELTDSLREEYKVNQKEGEPYVSPNWESTVDEVMAGRIPYTNNQSRDLSQALVGAEIDSNNAEIVVFADGEYVGTSNAGNYTISGKPRSGMSYIAVPNARRTTDFRGLTLVPIIPKRYSEIMNQEGQFIGIVNSFISTFANNFANPSTKQKALAAFSHLAEYLNLARLDYSITRDNGLVLKKVEVDANGNKIYVTKGNKTYLKSTAIQAFPPSATPEEIIAAFKNALIQLEVPVRINKDKVGNPKYIKSIIEENLASTYATSLKSEAAWFTFKAPINIQQTQTEEAIMAEAAKGNEPNTGISDNEYMDILDSETVATPVVPKATEEYKKPTPRVVKVKAVENGVIHKTLTPEETEALLKTHSQYWLDNASDDEILYALGCQGF